jgi:hypothetical protein
MAEADPDIIIPVLPYDTESEDDETADDGVRERRELQVSRLFPVLKLLFMKLFRPTI